jgi:hypothetical protein
VPAFDQAIEKFQRKNDNQKWDWQRAGGRSHGSAYNQTCRPDRHVAEASQWAPALVAKERQDRAKSRINQPRLHAFHDRRDNGQPNGREEAQNSVE